MKKKAIKKKYKFTNKEARKLAQHDVVKNFIKALDKTPETDMDSDAAATWVTRHKLQWEVMECGGNATVFKNKQNKLVIKLNGVFDPEEPHPLRAAPTAVIVSKNYVVRVQPIVRTTDTVVEAAMDFFDSKPYEDTGEDFHSGNVGKLGNKFVVIDW